MKVTNLKWIKEVKSTHLIEQSCNFIICYLTISSLKYLKVTVLLFLLSCYLFFDKKMSLIIFEKWTSYFCFLKELKFAKSAHEIMRSEGGEEGQWKGKERWNSDVIAKCSVLSCWGLRHQVFLASPETQTPLKHLKIYFFKAFWAKAQNQVIFFDANT